MAMAVTDEEILSAMRFRQGRYRRGTFFRKALLHLNKLLLHKIKSDTVVCVITGSALKQPDVVRKAVAIHKKESMLM